MDGITDDTPVVLRAIGRRTQWTYPLNNAADELENLRTRYAALSAEYNKLRDIDRQWIAFRNKTILFAGALGLGWLVVQVLS